jgi:hypothetical protein
MKWVLQTDENRSEEIANTDQLRQRLVQLHEQAKLNPVFAVLNASDGSTLAIGLGRELSVLSYTAPEGWPAKHIQGDIANEGLVTYKFFGHFTEMPARYAVAVADAVEVVVDLFDAGRLSEKLLWDED